MTNHSMNNNGDLRSHSNMASIGQEAGPEKNRDTPSMNKPEGRGLERDRDILSMNKPGGRGPERDRDILSMGKPRGRGPERDRDILSMSKPGGRGPERDRDILSMVAPIVSGQHQLLDEVAKTPTRARGILDRVQAILIQSIVEEQGRLLDLVARAPDDLKQDLLTLAHRRLANQGKALEIVSLGRVTLEEDLGSSMEACAESYRELLETLDR